MSKVIPKLVRKSDIYSYVNLLSSEYLYLGYKFPVQFWIALYSGIPHPIRSKTLVFATKMPDVRYCSKKKHPMKILSYLAKRGLWNSIIFKTSEQKEAPMYLLYSDISLVPEFICKGFVIPRRSLPEREISQKQPTPCYCPVKSHVCVWPLPQILNYLFQFTQHSEL